MAKTYTAAGTVAAGDVYTAAAHNIIATDVNNFIVPPACRLIRATAQTIPNSADTIISMSSAEYDTDSMATTGASSRITISTPGIYLITYEVKWATGATFGRVAFVGKNGSSLRLADARVSPTTGVLYITSSAVASLIATDYLVPYVFQVSGGNFDVVTDSGYSCALTATWIGRTS